MADALWHGSHVAEDPPKPGWPIRWCSACNRMILSNVDGVTDIGREPCEPTP